MSVGGAGWRRVLRFFRADPASDVDVELRFHFEQKIADFVAQGMTAGAARARATREFGDPDSVRSDLVTIDARIARRRGRAEWWESTAQDLAYVVRGLRRSPGFTIAVVGTIALGVGANGAIFSLLDRLLLAAPAGVESPSHLQRLYARTRERADGPKTSVFTHFSFPQFAAIHDATTDLGVVAAFSTPDSITIGRGDAARGAIASWVSPDYFSAVGVEIQRGRLFAPDEGRIDVPAHVVVISHAFWTRALQRDTAAIGRILDINRQQFTVVGITRPGFAGLNIDATDLFMPLNAFPVEAFRGVPWYQLVGTYLNLVARSSDKIASTAIVARATLAYNRSPTDPRVWRDSASLVLAGPIVESRGPELPDSRISLGIRIGGVAILILLIACANVSNLLLVRATRRQREVAVRLALGVSRARLVGQFLTESLVLACLAGIAAVGVAWWGGTMLRRLLLPEVHWASGPVDTRFMAFTTLVAVGIATGLAPVWFARRQSVVNALKGAARDGRARSPLRTALLVAQTALSVVLLAGAGLFLRSLHNVETIRTGYDADSIVFVGAGNRELNSRLPDFLAGLRLTASRMRDTPGVIAVAYAATEPMRGYANFQIALPGRDSLPRLNGAIVDPSMNFVSADFFRAVGMRILSGRTFASDAEANAMVANELMAQTLWPGESPIGKCVLVGQGASACAYVIGVSENSRRSRLVEEPTLQYFRPSAYAPTLVLRVDPKQWATIAAAATADLKRQFPAFETIYARHMLDRFEREVRPWRISASLFAAFGLLAITIAAFGVYSVTAYAVSQRTHEMGVRVALGAQVTIFVSLVVGEGLRLLSVGVGLGVGIALACGRLVTALLYGVAPGDAGVMIAAGVTLLLVGMTAALLPALRAARVGFPALALRCE